MHFDSSPNLFMQLHGVKNFILVQPQLWETLRMYPATHPAARQTRIPARELLHNLEAKLKGENFHKQHARLHPFTHFYHNVDADVLQLRPNNVLYIPPFHFHLVHVPNVSPSVSANVYLKPVKGSEPAVKELAARFISSSRKGFKVFRETTLQEHGQPAAEILGAAYISQLIERCLSKQKGVKGERELVIEPELFVQHVIKSRYGISTSGDFSYSPEKDTLLQNPHIFNTTHDLTCILPGTGNTGLSQRTADALENAVHNFSLLVATQFPAPTLVLADALDLLACDAVGARNAYVSFVNPGLCALYVRTFRQS
jgi:hypothetical protein